MLRARRFQGPQWLDALDGLNFQTKLPSKNSRRHVPGFDASKLFLFRAYKFRTICTQIVQSETRRLMNHSKPITYKLGSNDAQDEQPSGKISYSVPKNQSGKIIYPVSNSASI